MGLYKVRISESIWDNKDYQILSYEEVRFNYNRDNELRDELKKIIIDLEHSGFYYGMNNTYVFDSDDSYKIVDEKFMDVPRRLRQIIRDDKLNSLSL